jgi:capsular polysaccharide transport system permease protein
MLQRRSGSNLFTRLRLSRARKVANPLFILTVVVPTFLATLYFGLFASDVYISEAQFVVRSPDKPSASGLGVLLKSVGFSNAGDEIFVAQKYVASRDALKELNRQDAIRTAYTRPGISTFDRFNPLGISGTFEDLYEYFEDRIDVEHDTISSITTLSVRAYTAQDAQRINRQLLDLAENLVNRLNNRGEADLLGYSQREVREAEEGARRSSRALAAFRQRSGIVDPERQASVQLQLVSKLQDELIGARLQLQQLEAIAPDNPQIPQLRTRIAGLGRAIDAEVGRAAGSQRSLSAAAVQYQRLTLDNEYADKRLAAALASLQEARNEARRKQAYVERIVESNLPDDAEEPRRLRGILSVFILGLVAYGILSMLLAGVREHRD